MPPATLPRPAERVAILSLILVFLCGGVAGAMAMSYWHHRSGHRGGSPASSINMSVQEWRQKLDLSDEQTRQLTSILDDFSRYYDNVLSDGNSRVMQILNAEQKLRYEKMVQAHREKAVATVP
jgi:predicted phage-related endonuclease